VISSTSNDGGAAQRDVEEPEAMVVEELMALADSDESGEISREEHRALFPPKNSLWGRKGVHPTDRI
jgi:hypothetical protein